MAFQYKEILSFFDHCYVIFPYREILSYFYRLYKKLAVICFSAPFDQKRRNKQMTAVLLKRFTVFLQSIQKSCFMFTANTYEKHVVIKEYCIAQHDAEFCFLLSCRYLI